MVKKKLSGQTVAIIILAILLLLAIGFGGVYAYYSARSNKVSGKIVMANLKISLISDVGDSGKTEIIISNGVNVLPGQPLQNSPLIVDNESNTNIYLVVVYELNATNKDGIIEDEHEDAVLGLGFEYINPYATKPITPTTVSNQNWKDYVFDASKVNHENAENKIYRCLVCLAPTPSETEVTVIKKDGLALAPGMGNEYQSATIAMTFQAFAIGAESLELAGTNAEKCKTVVEAIYVSQSCRFLYNYVGTT